jgi:hypothetical protein
VLGNTPWQVSVNSNSAAYPFGNVNSVVTLLLSSAGEPGIGMGNNRAEKYRVGPGIIWLINSLYMLSFTNAKLINLILNVPLPPSFGYSPVQ